MTTPSKPPPGESVLKASAQRFGSGPQRLLVLMLLAAALSVGLFAAGRWSTRAGDTRVDADAVAFAGDQPSTRRNAQSELSALRAAIAAAKRGKQADQDNSALQLLEQTADLLQTQAEQQARLQAELALLRQRLNAAPGESNGTSNARQSSAGTRRLPDRQQQMQRLIATGATANEAEAVLAFTDELQLQQIEARYRLLRDRLGNASETRDASAAERGRARFRELRALGNTEQQVRDTFGDTAYDRYLYATDQPNRVRIDRVLPSSNAERAGLAPGDLLLSYDRQTVRSLDDLLRGAANGNEGDSATIEVLRGNERIAINLPRGPLGIQGQPESVNPNSVLN